MTRTTPLLAILALSLLFSVPASPQEKGSWHAANRSAKVITGDVTFGVDKLTWDFVAGFPLAQIRALTPADLAIAFDLDPNTPGSGFLYRIYVPASQKFLNKNSLCGGDNTHWMVTYVRGKSLQLAFFSSEPPPQFTPEAFANPTNLCGIYGYAR